MREKIRKLRFSLFQLRDDCLVLQLLTKESYTGCLYLLLCPFFCLLLRFTTALLFPFLAGRRIVRFLSASLFTKQFLSIFQHLLLTFHNHAIHDDVFFLWNAIIFVELMKKRCFMVASEIFSKFLIKAISFCVKKAVRLFILNNIFFIVAHLWPPRVSGGLATGCMCVMPARAPFKHFRHNWLSLPFEFTVFWISMTQYSFYSSTRPNLFPNVDRALLIKLDFELSMSGTS